MEKPVFGAGEETIIYNNYSFQRFVKGNSGRMRVKGGNGLEICWGFEEKICGDLGRKG
jgi:hypothetical protein